jgi:hypothetical protein
MFEDILPELPNVKAVCYECEGVDEDTVISTLERLRKMIIDLSSNKDLVAKLEASV